LIGDGRDLFQGNISVFAYKERGDTADLTS